MKKIITFCKGCGTKLMHTNNFFCSSGCEKIYNTRRKLIKMIGGK